MTELAKSPPSAVASSGTAFPPVSQAEAGQKLLRFLTRRLGLPQAVLHRWIRTGQIRRNGHRCKPFECLTAGDQIRIPPQASPLAPDAPSSLPSLPLPPLIGKAGDIWAYNKPAGLAVQGGTGQMDSICGRLRARFQGEAFVPAPAHRLDKDTSGVLLVGASFQALRILHDWFVAGQIHKEYLCWVHGRWNGKSRWLRHWLLAENGIRALGEEVPGSRLSVSFVRPLLRGEHCSLLQVLLLTGRKRQIRAQLAASGHAIVGDTKYAGGHGMKLHCARLILPGGLQFSCLPPWEGKFRLDSLPPLLKIGAERGFHIQGE